MLWSQHPDSRLAGLLEEHVTRILSLGTMSSMPQGLALGRPGHSQWAALTSATRHNYLDNMVKLDTSLPILLNAKLYPSVDMR